MPANVVECRNERLIKIPSGQHYCRATWQKENNMVSSIRVRLQFVRPTIFGQPSTSRTEFPYLHPQKVIASVRVYLSPALYARGPRCPRQVDVYRTSPPPPPPPPRTVRSGFLLLAERFVGQTVKFRRPRFVAVAPPPGACLRHTCTRARRAGVSATMIRQRCDDSNFNDTTMMIIMT